jgi:hypothetical protein
MLLRQFVALILAAVCLTGGVSFAQNPASTSPPIAQSSSAKPSNALWQNLSFSQKKALAPLAPHWAQISPAQKNKWLAMSNNFENLSPREQATLHNRMADWAALSPQQRAQARLSFNETKTLGADQKKSQWEAYQALSQDDRKKLAAQQTTKIQGAATASQAPSPQKVIPLLGKSPPTESANKSVPIIVIDKKTLLPTAVVAPEGT